MRFYKILIFFCTLVVILSALSFFVRPRINKRVLDCSLGPNNCEQSSINNSVETCVKYSQYNPNHLFKCLFDIQELNRVNYIADPLNYISAPFTELKFYVEIIDVDLSQPWDIELLEDGSIFVTEQNGKIKYIRNESINTLYEVPALNVAESGLLGLAIDPEYTKNHYIYIYYTYDFDIKKNSIIKPETDEETRVLNRLSRLTYIDGSLIDEKILLDEIPGSLWHSGSRLSFGPDGKLYVSTGDANEYILAQDPSFLGGKILRLNPDGSVPEDNPFKGYYAYSLGHRNPQGLAWDLAHNQLYSSEHGHTRYDEINIIEPGKNYGWGSYKCGIKNLHWRYSWIYELFQQDFVKGIVTPLVCFTKYTMAPSGMEFISDENSPWYGSLFVASLRGKHLHRYVLNKGKVQHDEIFFVSEGVEYVGNDDGMKIDNRIRDVEYYNGSIYLIGDYFGLIRITPIKQ